MEKLQQDSTIPLADHQQKVLGALAETAKTPQAPGVAADNNPLSPAKPTAAAIGGSLFSATMQTHAEQTAAGKHNASSARTKQNSLFLGGGSGKALAVAGKRVALVPMSYAEKKMAAKDDLSARSRISGMSLTGTTSSGGKAVPIKGAAVTPAMSKTLGMGWLLQELSIVTSALQNPYKSGTKRLMTDLSKGLETAESFVRYNPVMAHSMPKPAQGTAE